MLKDKTTRSNVRPTGQRPALGSQYRDIGIKAVAAAAQQKEPNIEKQRKKGGNPMSETREARNSVDKSEKVARQAFEKSSAAIEQNFSSALEKTRDVNVKLIEMAHHSADATFELAHDIAVAKTPSDFGQALTTHATKQFELFNMQMSELASLAQTISGPGTDQFVRSFNQTFKGGS
jgi:hypothetical protein